MIAKLGKMRKAVDWTVYPEREDGTITIQADHYICAFDTNGRGMLSARQSGGAYFHHLNRWAGATEVAVPQEVIDMAKEAQPKKGDTIGGMVRIA